MFNKVPSRLLPVLLIVLVFVLPMVLADLAFKYYQVHPKEIKKINRGELLNPTLDVKSLVLVQQANDNTNLEFKNKWSLLYLTKHHCDAHCEKNLYYLRQIHSATGKKRMSVQRIVATMNSDTHDEDLRQALQRYRDTKHLVFSNDTTDVLAQKFMMRTHKFNQTKSENSASIDTSDMLFIVDPEERIVLRYSGDFVAKDVLHDLKRLLRAAS